MPNRNHLQTKDQIHPAGSAAAVTPNDGADLPGGDCRSLYIGSEGDLSVVMADGGTVTFVNVPVGVLPIRVQRVRATGTTAANILALY